MRCKVYCSFKQVRDGEDCFLGFSPVTEGSQENKKFFKWTPGANIQIYTVNLPVAANFEMGKQYYLDFIPAED